MKAIAISIGNGNERIEVDGVTYIKSCAAEKWSHIIKFTASGYREQLGRTRYNDVLFSEPAEYVLKASSLEGASKASPGPRMLGVQREIIEIQRGEK